MKHLKMQMKLEKKTDRLMPFGKFLYRLARYALFTVFLMGFSIGVGMLGYRYLGQLTWVDSFHMTAMILTGMGPVAEMKTDAAKIFSSLYALYSGVVFLSATAVFFAPIIHRLLHILHIEDGDEG